MPIIELTAHDIAHPTRDILVGVAAIMLWPDDAAARERYVKTYIAEDVRAGAGAIRHDAPVGRHFAPTVELLRTAPRTDEIEPMATRRYKAGALVGSIVRAMLDAPAGTSLIAIKKSMLARLPADRKDRKGVVRSVAWLDKNAWIPLRPAAHLWAAHCQFVQQARDIALPCRDYLLAHFFAVSEAFLTAGAACNPMRAGPMLDTATAWRPPSRLALPAID